MNTIERPLYFDYHATTPVDRRVVEAMLPYFSEKFGNAESHQHAYGWEAKAAINQARQQVSELINAQPNEIIFTSGATESIHLALLGFLETQERGSHLITASTEHKATLEVCTRAKKLGYEITILDVDSEGRLDVQNLLTAIRPNTVMVSLMHGNNEIGTLHPIAELGPLLRAKGIVLHVDAAQTAGKHPIDVQKMEIDLLSISSHKLYGPKGVGALYVRRQPNLASSNCPKHDQQQRPSRIELAALFAGGGQESGLRGGTHNVPGIVGFGLACEIARREGQVESERLQNERDRILDILLKRFPNIELNGPRTSRLCNNINITVRDVAADDLIHGLRSIAYSSASACSMGSGSHVLKAIGKSSVDPFRTTLRFGLGRFNSREDIDRLIEVLSQTIEKHGKNSKPIENSAP